MNIPVEIFVSVLGAIMSGQFMVIWYQVRKISSMDSRLARMETAMEIRWNIDMRKLEPKSEL